MDNREIKISFLGGAGDIGASCALVEVGNTAVLVDCGVRFNSSSPLPDLSMLHDKRVDAIVVTHAHSDHTGGLPVVCQAFPDAPVYATHPTIDIATILLKDALKLMNTEDREGDVPLYTEKQVEQVCNAFTPAHHGQELAIGDSALTFLPASHILGASMLHLATPAGNVLMTGDYSVSAQRTVPALARPTHPVDLLVSEATYGDRLHEDRDMAEKRLIDQIKEVVEAGGRALIPAFAVGRAQEVLLILKRALRNGALPAIPVFVDGMVRAVCDVYGKNEKYVSRELSHDIRKAAHPFYTNGVIAVKTPGERRELLGYGPCVIVASSGMLSGGASAFYAASLVSNPKDAVLITGYQDEESPGRALLALSEAQGARELKIGDRIVEVKCKVRKYGLSAHADRMQMVGFIESMRPKTVALVHGGAAARKSLAEGLGVNDVIAAEDGQIVVRTFPAARRASTRKESRGVDELDIDTARKLLGPPTGVPVSAGRIAEAWFGGRAGAEDVNRLADKLESLNLVRRDDNRRHMLFVLGPSETDGFPEEAALEEALKRDNPKGRLLELCMRRRLEPPSVEFEVDGAFFSASMVLGLGESILASGAQRAASKKTAEQLAARVLLEKLEENDRAGKFKEVGKLEARVLKTANPKGRLVEWCAANRNPPPEFEERAVVGGFQVRGTLKLPGWEIESDWFGAKTKKAAEQAAAKALLERIENSAEGGAANEPRPSESALSDQPFQADNDPMMLLNEMRQAGVVVDFGYDFGDAVGPCHQPVFPVAAWAILEDGRRLETAQVSYPSKKAGRRGAAQNLTALLRELGLLSRREGRGKESELKT